jgi:LacI family transcriptional regulator
MADRTPTMRDVAERAGVSIQTVSCVVNEKGNISPRTRKRVLKAIAELHYRPHHIARSMRTRQTGLLGMLILDITNPVHSVIASAVESAAYARGYKVVLYNVSENAEREQECLEASAEGLVDGLILVNTVDREHTFAFLAESRLHAVLIDCLASRTIPVVSVDNFQAAYVATQHAIALGHRRIAHLAGSDRQWIGQQRIQGYQQAVADSQLPYQRVFVSNTGQWDYRAGYLTMSQVLSEPERPTAIFAASDLMAIGAYRAIAEAGLRVPHDISVIGFDDIEAAAYAVPPLTTIRQPFREIAESAVSLVVDLITGQEMDDVQRTLAAELVIRESTREVDHDGR